MVPIRTGLMSRNQADGTSMTASLRSGVRSAAAISPITEIGLSLPVLEPVLAAVVILGGYVFQWRHDISHDNKRSGNLLLPGRLQFVKIGSQLLSAVERFALGFFTVFFGKVVINVLWLFRVAGIRFWAYSQLEYIVASMLTRYVPRGT